MDMKISHRLVLLVVKANFVSRLSLLTGDFWGAAFLAKAPIE